MEENKNHSLKIEYGQGLTATAVSDVLFFNDREVRFLLLGGGKVSIVGEKLKISGFNKQAGELRLSGAVTAVKYLSASMPTFKKLFK